MVSGTSTRRPTRSNIRPKAKDPAPLTAIAIVEDRNPGHLECVGLLEVIGNELKVGEAGSHQRRSAKVDPVSPRETLHVQIRRMGFEVFRTRVDKASSQQDRQRNQCRNQEHSESFSIVASTSDHQGNQ